MKVINKSSIERQSSYIRKNNFLIWFNLLTTNITRIEKISKNNNLDINADTINADTKKYSKNFINQSIKNGYLKIVNKATLKKFFHENAVNPLNKYYCYWIDIEPKGNPDNEESINIYNLRKWDNPESAAEIKQVLIFVFRGNLEIDTAEFMTVLNYEFFDPNYNKTNNTGYKILVVNDNNQLLIDLHKFILFKVDNPDHDFTDVDQLLKIITKAGIFHDLGLNESRKSSIASMKLKMFNEIGISDSDEEVEYDG